MHNDEKLEMSSSCLYSFEPKMLIYGDIICKLPIMLLGWMVYQLSDVCVCVCRQSLDKCESDVAVLESRVEKVRCPHI